MKNRPEKGYTRAVPRMEKDLPGNYGPGVASDNKLGSTPPNKESNFLRTNLRAEEFLFHYIVVIITLFELLDSLYQIFH